MQRHNLYGSAAPHVRADHSTASLMKEVLFSLIPILIFAVCYFGVRVLLIMAVSVASAMLSEGIFEKICKKKLTLSDGSAAVTGVMLSCCLPVSVPWWIPAVGSFFAIIFVKELFGGIGKNFVNPALAARCFLLVSFSSSMASFRVDAVTVATPLSLLQSGQTESLPSAFSAFLGVIPGSIGETSKLLIILSAIYLISRKVIDYRIPVSFIGTVFVLSYLFGRNGLYEILVGGVMFGAVFMATDYTTSPMNRTGKWIYGTGCGLLTVLIRCFGSYPEGVSFAILLMNLTVPLLDRLTMPRVYGTAKKKRNLPWERSRHEA